MKPTALVDAENVRRSTWPNLGREELLERCREWAEREDARLIVVFDGAPPVTDAADVEGSGAGTADDRIAELAALVEGPVWIVTSDRALRDRVRSRADRVMGGGTFLRLILRD